MDLTGYLYFCGLRFLGVMSPSMDGWWATDIQWYVDCSCGQITSQVPYFEEFIGPPHTYTVDYDDVNALHAVLSNITSSTVGLIFCVINYPSCHIYHCCYLWRNYGITVLLPHVALKSHLSWYVTVAYIFACFTQIGHLIWSKSISVTVFLRIFR